MFYIVLYFIISFIPVMNIIVIPNYILICRFGAQVTFTIIIIIIKTIFLNIFVETEIHLFCQDSYIESLKEQNDLEILDLLQTSVYRGNKTPNKDRKPEKLRAQQKTTCKSAEMFLCGVGLEIEVGVYISSV